MAIFDGFLDNLQNGVTNPKGNLADWQHANRLYVNDNFRHAPKNKFLYHVTFYLTREAQSIVPELQQYNNVVGMLVKSADLPSFSANVETKNKYNRKKNVQTNIEYNPVNIAFHDDNFGATTALLEAYFKYYYADSFQSGTDAFGNLITGDTLYKGEAANKYKFGLDNNIPAVPFFDRIEIAQMSRRLYTKYTLVRPILTDWQHDSVDNTDSVGTMQNSITVAYDTVFYDRGGVEAGDNGDPAGFGATDKYDKTPSPATLLGGGDVGIFGIIGGAGDILGGQFNLAQGAIAGVNLVDQARTLSSEGLRESGLNLASSLLGGGGSSSPGGVRQITFPKTRGTGGAASETQASESLSSTGIEESAEGLESQESQATEEPTALERSRAKLNDLETQQQSARQNLRNAEDFAQTARSLRARGAPADQIERAEGLARTFRAQGEYAQERVERIEAGLPALDRE